jgi:hypothetical protein
MNIRPSANFSQTQWTPRLALKWYVVAEFTNGGTTGLDMNTVPPAVLAANT